MPQIKTLSIDTLSLDLRNFRTVPQKTEAASVRALISIDPAYFWALAKSLIEDGWHGTENVVVLRNLGNEEKNFIVKEGNRRVGALKLVLGKIPAKDFSIPADLDTKISNTTEAWKKANSVVPCNVFDSNEAAQAERLVALTHAKGEKAGRLEWNSVARARYNRDQSGGSEPALDLLEAYLKSGKNLTQIQKERWGGEYPVSVLAEGLKRLGTRLGVADSKEVAALYPKDTKWKDAFESLLHDIGVETIGFPHLRNATDDALAARGFPVEPAPSAETQTRGGAVLGNSSVRVQTRSASNLGNSSTAGTRKTGPNAPASNDPRSVIRALKRFTPKGNGREKLVRLLNEARTLKIDKHPHAFCFLLRSMFEISAKCYCDDHKATGGPSCEKPDGSERKLVDILADISKHLSSNGANKGVAKELHGATAELAKPEGFLSVTSMNQLVHNRKFSVDETHISTLFHNILPLLEAMSR